MDAALGSALVWIDPQAIRDWYGGHGRWSKLRAVPDRVGLPARVRRGSWDRRVIPFAAHPTFRLMRALEQTGYDVGRLRAALGDSFPRRPGKPPWRLADPEFTRYVERYREIALSMRQHGYRPAVAGTHLRIAIARDGRPVKVSGGNHRLALAQLVDLPAVQAEVRFVHREWIEATGRSDAQWLVGRLEAAGYAVCKSNGRESGLPAAMPGVPGG